MDEKSSEKPKLKTYEWFWALLPIGLVAIGGAIGGLIGGGAAAWNVKVFGSARPNGRKYVYTGLISLGSVIMYVMAASAFVILVQGQ